MRALHAERILSTTLPRHAQDSSHQGRRVRHSRPIGLLFMPTPSTPLLPLHYPGVALKPLKTLQTFQPLKIVPLPCWSGRTLRLLCSLCTPQFVLQSAFFRCLVISPPISGFWAAGAFSYARCSHVIVGAECIFPIKLTTPRMVMLEWEACVHSCSSGRHCALRTNFYLRTGDKKCKNISYRKLNHRHPRCEPGHMQMDHRMTLTYYCSGTMSRPRDEIFFSKIQRRFVIQHDSNYTATKRKVCLGPGTRPLESCFAEKSVLPNFLPSCWDFFAKMGGGAPCFLSVFPVSCSTFPRCFFFM